MRAVNPARCCNVARHRCHGDPRRFDVLASFVNDRWENRRAPHCRRGEAGLTQKSIMVPCCNFWLEEKLGRDELVAAIEGFYSDGGEAYERVVFPFRGRRT